MRDMIVYHIVMNVLYVCVLCSLSPICVNMLCYLQHSREEVGSTSIHQNETSMKQ